MTTTSGGLQRRLTLRDLIVSGLLFIGPLAPVGVFGVLDARSGGAVALVYVVATIAMSFTAWSYARMSAAVPKAGSVFAYASAGLGRAPGFAAGWMIMLDYLFIPSVASLFVGIATNSLLPQIPVWLATGAAIVVVTALNLTGVKVAAIVGTVVLVVEIVLLVVFVVAALVVLAGEGPARPWLSPLTGFEAFAPLAVLGAVSVAVLSFLGFDAIASFAEENTGSSRQVGRALLFCLALSGVLFFVQTYLASLLSPLTPQRLAQDPNAQDSAFYDMLRAALGGWLAVAVTAVKAIAPAFSAMIAQAAVSRLLFGMARDGQLPAGLARIDRRTHVPRNATLLAAVVTLLVSVWAASAEDGLEVLSSMVTVGALTAFVLLHASVIGYFAVPGRERSASTVVIPVIGGLISVVVLVTASGLALAVAAVWLVLGLITYAVRNRTTARG
ncbi:amino acid/polyamine/organocation transporter, APC superfamily (TC 2.A.3) [Saccharopolyspora kobensis]|uniref:Amino acid/polyamine/organocation transporter, APC superfamily n=1 Tax=Saccharopolyspora kobensis TaxID=146035 RepID=A0A1H5TZ31_9PSEU|nr:APC family permease [Saccharopolyspora kobensis]SEF68104.1 amino acid/polyamine/organocation transporter, APC superfamily (TC 2.A.3) [Saccharopolyspora kobensis]SFC40370.1 amino acid/polyamine/organocation transporter, APC superfamily [Saccharopolyspora kobensis]